MIRFSYVIKVFSIILCMLFFLIGCVGVKCEKFYLDVQVYGAPWDESFRIRVCEKNVNITLESPESEMDKKFYRHYSSAVTYKLTEGEYNELIGFIKNDLSKLGAEYVDENIADGTTIQIEFYLDKSKKQIYAQNIYLEEINNLLSFFKRITPENDALITLLKDDE